MFISGLGTAVPSRQYSQEECWASLQRSPVYPALTDRARAVARKVLQGRQGVETRSLALASVEEVFDTGPDRLHQRFKAAAPDLAARAARAGLESACLHAGEIDGVVISTCTGYLCPGLTSYVCELLDLRPDVVALDLVGQGCGAAIPNMRTGEAFIRSGRCRHVLSICVEVCSAAFYLDNDPGVIVSACLFGDGAGAVVLSETPGPRRIEWSAARSVTNPADRELLRFEQVNGMLRNILSPRVPALAACYTEMVLRETLAEAGLEPSDLDTYIWHGGGKLVLDAIRDTLELNESDLRWSREILRTRGNLSSGFVYFVLQAALDGGAAPGWWWMSSFGAGFSCHGALLRVD